MSPVHIDNHEDGSESDPTSQSILAALWDFPVALAMLSIWPLRHFIFEASSERRARAFVFCPIIGLGLGFALAAIDRSTQSILEIRLRSLMVILLAVLIEEAMIPLGLARTLRTLMPAVRPAFIWLFTIAALVLEVACLTSIGDPHARTRALILTLMLSRWVIVPVSYGLKPIGSDGLGVAFDGGVKFREFAVSSVIALGTAMALYEAAALAAIILVALAVLALRLLFSRGQGGVDGYSLAAGAQICELVIFSVVTIIR
jgi:cobalamin synthase